MTAPIAGFNSVTPASPPSYYAIQITGTAQGVEISQALEDAVASGLIEVGTSTVVKDGAGLRWTISTTDLLGHQSICTTDDWIVIGTDPAGKTMLSLEFYGGPNSPYTALPLYSASFSGAS